jgi:hypothetical protein
MLLRIQTIEGYAAVDALRKGLKGNCYFVIKPDYNEPSSVAFWVRFYQSSYQLIRGEISPQQHFIINNGNNYLLNDS